MFNYNTLKKIMFKFEPENAHTIGEYALRALPYCKPINNLLVEKNFLHDEILSQNILGTTFSNPIGLGAGFDKNATMIKSMPAMGFGYTEIGTMTPKAQEGKTSKYALRLHTF